MVTIVNTKKMHISQLTRFLFWKSIKNIADIMPFQITKNVKYILMTLAKENS